MTDQQSERYEVEADRINHDHLYSQLSDDGVTFLARALQQRDAKRDAEFRARIAGLEARIDAYKQGYNLMKEVIEERDRK